MDEKIQPKLQGVAQTLLIPLCTRAKESKRPDALLKDEMAEKILEKLDCDISRLTLSGHDEAALIQRVHKFDSVIRDFLSRHPDGVIVHIGCGLDTRFDRLDNGRVEWFDLDLPEVIQLRRGLIGTERDRYHLIAGSITEPGWLEAAAHLRQRPFLFAAEGVLPYFENDQVKSLFLMLRDQFPGCEIVCDAHAPYVLWMDNLQLALSKVDARLRWGLKHGKDVEDWGAGIKMLEEWYYFRDDEPRMKPYRWMGKIPGIGKSTGIFHYRLGR